VPVMITAQRDAEQLLADQIVENKHRADISAVDEARGYVQLSMFGLSPDQIAQHTHVKKDRVDAGLKAGASKVIEAKVAPSFGLDVLAKIAEFEEDQDDVDRLLTIAANNPGNLDNVIASIRAQHEREAERAALLAAITDNYPTVTVLDDGTWWGEQAPDEWRPIFTLAFASHPHERITADRDSVDITDSAIRDLVEAAHVALRLVRGYHYGAGPDAESYGKFATHVQWFAKLAGSKLVEWSPLDEADLEESAAQRERREQAEREQAERAARQDEWSAARDVRNEWLLQLVQRKTLPKDALLFAARQFATELYENDTIQNSITLFGLMGTFAPANPYDETAGGLNAAKTAHLAVLTTPAAANRWLLSAALALGETAFGLDPFDVEDAARMSAYVAQLETWGYPLSDIEIEARDAALKLIAEASVDDDGADDEEDGE